MRLISEGIGHLDDLDINDFINIIKNIANQEISEKVDGSNLAFGLDSKGKFYTTRSAKSSHSNLIYKATDYPNFSTFNGFRAAHAALQTQAAVISQILKPGQAIEIEVVVGAQPNVVAYNNDNKNYVLFLRPLFDTPRATFNELVTALKDKESAIEGTLITSNDGVTLSSENAKQTFVFSTPQRIDSAAFKSAAVDKQIAELEKFLGKQSAFNSHTNAELLSLNLAKVPSAERPDAKSAKSDLISYISDKFKLPIKAELLRAITSRLKSTYSADEGDGIGIEGAVLLDPQTGDQVKIVDKDVYSTVNQFNHTVRAQIMGMVRSTDLNAALEDQGGVIGNMKIKIADLFGDARFAKGAYIRQALKAVGGTSPAANIVNFTQSLKLPADFNGIKRKILAVISTANKELTVQREDFNSGYAKYRLKLKSGKVIGLSPEVVSRTLTSFAEAGVGVRALFDKVKVAKRYDQIIAVFYGKYAASATAKAVPDVEGISESLLLERKLQTDKRLYSGKDAWTLLNIYLATVVSSVLIYKAGDKQGIRILKDKTHFRLKAWTSVIGPLNFWGLAIWRSGSPEIARRIGTKASKEILQTTRRIPKLWWLTMHRDLSFGGDAPIKWEDHYKTLRYLQWHPNLKMDRINYLINSAFVYEALSFDQKIKFLNKLYYYVRQFVPSSPLLIRIRNIQSALLSNPVGTVAAAQVGMIGEGLLQAITAALAEDAEGTAAGDIASVDSTINMGIIRRQRNPNLSVNRRKLGRLKALK